MSPWTALLESLHSALIDELTDRHPEPKPELGMPQRHRQLVLPATGPLTAVICEVSFALAQPTAASTETRGFALIAVDETCAKRLKLDATQLWNSLIKRAGGEFGFRGIQPRLGNLQELKSSTLPAGFAEPARVIWIPFKLGSGACYLGVGA
jgi:hypothetical protein